MITLCSQQSVSTPDVVFRSITVLHDLEGGEEDSRLFIYSLLPPTMVFNIKEPPRLPDMFL